MSQFIKKSLRFLSQLILLSLAASMVMPALGAKATESSVKETKESSWTDHIKIKGDFRYRVELIDLEDDGKELRYRHRLRGRLGVHAEVIDDIDTVLQLGTGHPGGYEDSGDPVSNNQSFTDAFSSKPIWLDLAFFDWHPAFVQGLNLVGGKMENPYYKVGDTELLWDPDLNPEGLALSYSQSFSIVELFLHSTGFWNEERKQERDSWLLGIQGGIKLDLMEERLYLLVGGGYVDYTGIKNRDVLWDKEDSYGNTATEIDVDGDGTLDNVFQYDNDYNLVNGFAELGGELINIPWAVFADFVVNTGAERKNKGWLAGALVGKCKKSLDVCLRYIYRQVRADAVLGLYTDSDFAGGGTDGKGHEWNVGFQIAKNVKSQVTYFLNQTPLHDPDTFHRAQFDLKLKY